MSATEDVIKIVEVEQTPSENAEGSAEAEVTEKAVKPAAAKRSRSNKYRAVRSKIDKTKKYSVAQAVALVQELSYSSFDGTIDAALVVQELGHAGSVTLPHNTGKSLNVVIVDDKVLKQIEEGDVNDIDVLVSDPQYMPKLARFGKVLGPKGLMPNPKSGTLTPNPEDKKKELEAGTMSLKTQKKMPVIHVTVGKVSMDAKKVAENVQKLISELGPKLEKLALSATMSPGVRVDVKAARKAE